MISENLEIFHVNWNNKYPVGTGFNYNVLGRWYFKYNRILCHVFCVENNNYYTWNYYNSHFTLLFSVSTYQELENHLDFYLAE